MVAGGHRSLQVLQTVGDSGESSGVARPTMRNSPKQTIPALAIAVIAMAAFLAPASASASSCPTNARQLNATQIQFDSTCILTSADWTRLGGSTSNPPQASAWEMGVYKTAPPYRSKSRMMSLLTQYDGGDCDPLTCRGKTPGSAGNNFNKKPPIDPSGSPAIKPLCPPGYVISTIPGEGTTKYTCVCYMWTAADIDNPLFPPDLAAIIAAGGYIPPTQYCILVPVTTPRRSGLSFVPAATMSSSPKVLADREIPRPQPRPDAASGKRAGAAASPTYRFRQVARVSLAKSGDRITCGLKPMVALSKILVKDPTDPTQNVVAGTGLGTVCRLRITKIKPPRLSAAQRRLVAQGNDVVAFRITGLPARGSRERERPMPYAAVKFLERTAAPVGANRYRMVQANSQGVAVWIGKFRKTARYTARAAWPFYQYACASYRFKRTRPPAFTG